VGQFLGNRDVHRDETVIFGWPTRHRSPLLRRYTAAELAARIGGGYCLAMPDAELVQPFRGAGGGSKPV
jgi:hypothetical protein